MIDAPGGAPHAQTILGPDNSGGTKSDMDKAMEEAIKVLEGIHRQQQPQPISNEVSNPIKAAESPAISSNPHTFQPVTEADRLAFDAANKRQQEVMAEMQRVMDQLQSGTTQ